MKTQVTKAFSLLLALLLLLTAAPIAGITDSSLLPAADAATYHVGDRIAFGGYPQSQVTDSATVSALDTVNKNWVSYRYYSGTGNSADGLMQAGDWMRYADFTYNGTKYRAVTFDNYRPYYTGYTGTFNSTFQYKNGYTTGNVYYFKYESLQWRILDPAAGLVLCESIIDAGAFQNIQYKNADDNEYYQGTDSTIYANDYATSSIRTFLMKDFYNAAFSDTEKTLIGETTLDNSAYNNDYAKYNGASTTDKIFLLSYRDMLNTDYGFSSAPNAHDEARQAKGTDYAKCQGLGVEATLSDYIGFSYWQLRSDYAAIVDCDMRVIAGSGSRSSYAACGIRPAFCFQSGISQSYNSNGGTVLLSSGACGENVTYTLGVDGVLTISGSGTMDHYYNDAPWYDFRNNIIVLTIQNGVTDIGNFACSGCNHLKSVSIPSSVTNIGAGAFLDCTGLTDVMLPDSLTNIGNSAFSGCSKLPEITIPNHITSIGEAAFSRCSALTEVEIPDSVTSVGQDAFWCCTQLSSVKLSDNLTSVSESMFYGCSRLMSVTIPNGATSIGSAAFNGCGKLTRITIPNTVTSIGEGAFYLCTGLKYVFYSGSISEWNSIFIDDHENNKLTASALHFNATDHKWDPGEITTVPSYTQPGVKTYRCTVSNCDAERTESIPQLPREALAGQNVTLNAASVEYNGAVRNPVVTVKNAAGVKLTEGTDYTVAVPAGRTVPGTYVYTVTGIGGYAGAVSKNFVIKPCTLKAENVTLYSATVEYNGAQRTPKVTVKSPWGVTLTEGTHYTVSVPSGRTVPGTYTYTVTGKGRFTGSVSKTFTIKPCTLTAENLSLSPATVEENGSQQSPTLTVKSPWGVTLTEGTHYTLAVPAGRTAPGTYTYTVTGKGRFTGTAGRDFVITESIRPTCRLAATNDLAGSQTVALTMHDRDLLGGYYWGTNADYTQNPYYDLTALSVGDFTRNLTLTAPGTYYFTAENRNGDTSDTKSVTFFRTTLDPNGGEVSPTVLLNQSDKTITLPTPVISGGLFQFWSSGDGEFGCDYTPDKNRSLTASFVPYDNIPPTIRLSSTNYNAATQTLTITLEDNKKLAAYYWGTDPDHTKNEKIITGGLLAADAHDVTQSGTYYIYAEDANGNHAETSVTYYTTVLNPNGGQVSPVKFLTRAGVDIKLPLPELENYTFRGWGVDTPDLTEIIYTPVSDRTLNAVWSGLPNTVVNAPAGLRATPNADGSVTLAWDPVSNATSYKVYRSSSPNTGYTAVGDAHTNSHTDYPGAGTAWYYKVKAVYTDSYNTIQSTLSANASASQPLLADQVTLYSASVEYNGKQRTPALTVKNAAGKKLTEGTDYTVSVPAGRTVPGTYTYTVTGIGAYTGTVSKNFVIRRCTLKTENVSLYSATVEYNAKLRTPKVTVKSPWGVTLTEGTHYTVTVPEGRTVPGTYVYKITGKGRFTGTVNANFVIKPCTLKAENVSLYSATVTYNGKLRTPKVTVTSPWGVTLTEGTHYTVTVPKGRTDPGTYVYIITGKGRFTGTVRKDFVINPK